MKTNTKASKGWIITVKASGEVQRTPFNPRTSLEKLQSGVAGYIELVTLRGNMRRFDGFCNDEGKLKGLPVNVPISRLYGRALVCGDVVICKHDKMGDTQGLTDAECEDVLSALLGVGSYVGDNYIGGNING